jgi:hypothetical protein
LIETLRKRIAAALLIEPKSTDIWTSMSSIWGISVSALAGLTLIITCCLAYILRQLFCNPKGNYKYVKTFKKLDVEDIEASYTESHIEEIPIDNDSIQDTEILEMSTKD